jgi:hypothetical protein
MLSYMPCVTGVSLFREELHAVFLNNFPKSFKTTKCYSQILYSSIKLITFEVNPFNEGAYLKSLSFLPINFDTATKFERFPIT